MARYIKAPGLNKLDMMYDISSSVFYNFWLYFLSESLFNAENDVE